MSLEQRQSLENLLESARPFLRGELESIDPALPSLIQLLRSVGAGECWHKHGTFLEHLLDVHRILKLWKAPDAVCLCGLFHSAYSNSYVNLAIFDPSTSRQSLRDRVGTVAERLIHLFCIVPRQSLIHDHLLFLYEDSELLAHLCESEVSLETHSFDVEEAWRKKLQSILPAEGIEMEHIKTGERVHVSRRVVAIFLLMTMADFSDQLFGFQDDLFNNSDGRFRFEGNNYTALWPGDGKPGLWLNLISRMGVLYTLIVREEEIFLQERNRSRVEVTGGRDEDVELVIPPVFDNCTKILDSNDQIESRDLYWGGVCDKDAEIEVLQRCVEKNPYVGEGRVVLAQRYLTQGMWVEAEREAGMGLKLLLEWGTTWDKRVPWDGWVAWARVLLLKAKECHWPKSSWGVLNLGLVK